MNIFKEIYRSMELSFGSPIKRGAYFSGNSRELLKASTLAKKSLSSIHKDLLLYVDKVEDGKAKVIAELLVSRKDSNGMSVHSTNLTDFVISVAKLEADYVDGKISKVPKKRVPDFFLGGL